MPTIVTDAVGNLLGNLATAAVLALLVAAAAAWAVWGPVVSQWSLGYKTGFVGVCLVLLLTALLALRRRPHGFGHGEDTTLTFTASLTPNDVDQVERERQELRVAHDVRPISGLKVGELLSRLGDGVYGFVVPWQVPPERLDSSVARGTSQLEVHKLEGGAIHLVLYVAPETAHSLQDATRGPFSLFAYPTRYTSGETLVSLPLNQVASSSLRHFEPSPGERGYVLELSVSASPENARRHGPADNTLRADQERLSIQAREAANEFHRWMNDYNHHGVMSHDRKLVEWLYADDGAFLVSSDYQVFVSAAVLLKEMGYDTDPPPTKAEFMTGVKRAEQQRTQRGL